MKITNTQSGPRGVNTVNGPVLVEPGATVEAKVFSREREHIEAAGWFTVDGEYTEDDQSRSSAAQVTVKDGDGKDGVYIPSAEFNSMRSAFEQQASDMASLRSEIDGLNAAIGEKDAEIAKLKAGETQTAYTVTETSPGWFAVLDKDGKQVGNKMREDDANAFKAMTFEEQKQLLAE
ncbi:hypothetical protein JZX87_10030 [Agrobacterium sp. Ap1]|uniref:hypothetical protein n=1 Tax=Agrobacterium sp. Ap1 TaxID=2815337 RepID=UPI001A8DEBD5|nr:hypothetical protein [Agrobacterium sp. Ap1]MBO0141500.1 hypothetical protein [Agrobacterium sp. Ap1]